MGFARRQRLPISMHAHSKPACTQCASERDCTAQRRHYRHSRRTAAFVCAPRHSVSPRRTARLSHRTGTVPTPSTPISQRWTRTRHGTRGSAVQNATARPFPVLRPSFACGLDDDDGISSHASWIASIGSEGCGEAGKRGWAAGDASGRALRPTHPHAPHAADTL